MSAADDERRNRATIAKLGVMLSTVFTQVGVEALASIQDGSPLTGAPGQPVDTGYLKNSWQMVQDSPDSIVIGTNVAYAGVIEDGVRSSYDPDGTPRPKAMPGQGEAGRHIKSTVGGHHSVALTHANMDRLVESVKRRTVQP